MWSRKQLKDKAKYSMNQNYWKVVLVCLILICLGTAGGTTFNFGATNSTSSSTATEDIFSLDEFNDTYNQYEDEAFDMEYSDQYFDSDQSDEYWDGYYDAAFGIEQDSSSQDYLDGYNDGLIDEYIEEEMENDDIDNESAFSFDYDYNQDSDMSATVVAFLVIFIIVVVIVVAAIALTIAALIGNPLDLGARKFMVKNLNEKAEVKEVAYAFDSNYKNIVKIMFFRDLYTILWFLLFIIPGIVKSYEYFMIPYLLTENPDLTKEEAFALSKQMMKGQKWKTFVLNLSFIGWDFLSACTLGILNIFYVAPYRNLTFAALFEELNAAHGYPARYIQTNQQPYQQMNSYGQEDTPIDESDMI